MEATIEQTLQQGVAAHKEGKLQDAERLYRAILQSQPLHPDANHNLGLIAVSVNKADAALQLFKTALEANPKIEQFWLSYIDALIKEHEFATVKQVIEAGRKQGVSAKKLDTYESQVVALAPGGESNHSKGKKTFSEKRKRLAADKKRKKAQKQGVKVSAPSKTDLVNLLNYYQTGRYSEAEKLAISLTQEFPKHQFSWKVLGAVLGETGRKYESLAASQKSVQLAPQDAEAHFNLGNALQKLERLEEAEASYRQAIVLKPDHGDAHSNLGNTLQELGKLDEVEASYRQTIALKPDYAEAHYNLGNTLRELGRLDEAESSYRKAITLKSDFAEAYYNLGIALKEQGRLDDAKASYTQAIALKPDFAEAHSNLGNTLQELGRLEEAEASYRQAIALQPDYAEAHYNLGSTLKQLARFDEAEITYRQAIALKSDYAEAHSNLGNTLKELGRLEESEASHRQATALKPGYAEAHNDLGVTLRELGRLEEAETSYRQAIALKPDYAESYGNLGVALQELGRLDEAEASCRHVIALKPDFAEAHSLLGCIMHGKGDVDSALHCFEKAFSFDANLRINELRLMVLKSRAIHRGALGNSDIISNVDSDSRLPSNPLILSRAVEIELIEKLYEMTSRTLDNTKDARYGNGSCSLNFQLFEDESSIIKTVSSDLIRIVSEAVKSEVYVYDSFYNILGAGGGSHPHDHLQSQDNAMDLWKQKYSLVYYLSVGDQDCSEPGVLKLYSPDEDILPCKGMIVIVPSTTQHSAIYAGKTDRVMIGVNFYAL